MELLTLPEVADLLDMPVTRVHQLIRDGLLISIRSESGAKAVPAQFLQDGVVVKGLRSVITQLRDARYDDEDIVEWLFRDDETLPGAPITALRANRGSEVKRRAQVAGY